MRFKMIVCDTIAHQHGNNIQKICNYLSNLHNPCFYFHINLYADLYQGKLFISPPKLTQQNSRSHSHI